MSIEATPGQKEKAKLKVAKTQGGFPATKEEEEKFEDPSKAANDGTQK